jgi:heme exporter protein CcmD
MSSSALFDFSGHGYFIWASYGMLALAVVWELIFLRRRRQRAWDQAVLLAHEAPPRQATVKASSALHDLVKPPRRADPTTPQDPVKPKP